MKRSCPPLLMTPSILTVSYHIPREKVSSLIPSEFQENIIRVFARDPSKVKAVHEAFRRLMSNFYRGSDGTSHLPPSSTSPYYDSRNTTPERSTTPMAWSFSRSMSPTLGLSNSNIRIRKRGQSHSPSPRQRARLRALGDGTMDHLDADH